MPDDLCPTCGAYWQCDCPPPPPGAYHVFHGLDMAAPGDASAYVTGHVLNGQVTVDHVRMFDGAVYDTWRKKVAAAVGGGDLEAFLRIADAEARYCERPDCVLRVHDGPHLLRRG